MKQQGGCPSLFKGRYSCDRMEGHGGKHRAQVDHQTTHTWDLRSLPGHTIQTWWRRRTSEWVCECWVGGVGANTKAQIDEHIAKVRQDVVDSILMSPPTQMESAASDVLSTGKTQIGPFNIDFG